MPPLLLGALASIFIGISDTFGRASARRASSISHVSTQMFVGTFATLPLLLVVSSSFRSTDVMLGALSGVCVGLGLSIVYKAMADSSSAIAAPIAGVIAAVLPLTWDLGFGGGSISGLTAVGCAIAIAALAIVSYNPVMEQDARRSGITMGSERGVAGHESTICRVCHDGAHRQTIVGSGLLASQPSRAWHWRWVCGCYCGHGAHSLGLMQDLSFNRGAFVDGIKRVIPLSIPGIPFAFVVGVLVADEELLPAFASWASSWIIFAGAAQLAALTLLADNASAIVVIMTVFLINSRHAMYSATLRGRLAGYSPATRVLMSYLLVDQQFAVAETAPELEDPSSGYRLWHYLGSGMVLFVMWNSTVALGIGLGNVVREEWGLSFAVPILFLGLLMLSLKDRPGIVAAIVAAVVAVAGRTLPQGSGLLLAIVVGVAAAGLFAERGSEP